MGELSRTMTGVSRVRVQMDGQGNSVMKVNIYFPLYIKENGLPFCFSFFLKRLYKLNLNVYPLLLMCVCLFSDKVIYLHLTFDLNRVRTWNNFIYCKSFFFLNNCVKINKYLLSCEDRKYENKMSIILNTHVIKICYKFERLHFNISYSFH